MSEKFWMMKITLKSPDIETINTSAIQDLTFAWSFTIPLGQRYTLYWTKSVTKEWYTIMVLGMFKRYNNKKSKSYGMVQYGLQNKQNRFLLYFIYSPLPTVLFQNRCNIYLQTTHRLPRIANKEECRSECYHKLLWSEMMIYLIISSHLLWVIHDW